MYFKNISYNVISSKAQRLKAFNNLKLHIYQS